jgi:UDP-GlcNAc:undecaprenyl-phosphate GlcNAc-1-phosphate transferase
MEVRLQGDADWPDVWQEITRRAASLNLDSVWLDVNAPAWHEGYHRRWQRSGMGNGELKGWKVELPLFGHGQVIGRLIVAGTRDMECIGEILRDLAAMVSRVEAVASEVAPPGVLAKRNSGTEHTPVDSQLATAT